MVTVENLSFSYNKGFKLGDITFNLNNGLYALLGPNGAGKTTFIRCLNGNYKYRGKIETEGSIGYLPQNISFIDELTVWEMLEYIYCVKHISDKIDSNEIERCLSFVNLDDAKQKKISELSGGMVRRLGIAQAILGDPKLVVLDEPTSGLDPEERMRFKNMLYELNKDKNKVIVVSTHMVDDIAGICDKVIILSDGKVLAFDTEEDIKKQADGKVFEVPVYGSVSPEAVIIKKYGSANLQLMKVIDTKVCAGYVPVYPTLEEAYLCIVKNI